VNNGCLLWSELYPQLIVIIGIIEISFEILVYLPKSNQEGFHIYWKKQNAVPLPLLTIPIKPARINLQEGGPAFGFLDIKERSDRPCLDDFAIIFICYTLTSFRISHPAPVISTL